MTPDEREVVTHSIANLWIFQTMFVSQLLRSLRDDGGLSTEAIERLLERIDNDVEVLEGEDDRAFATNLLATARTRLTQ